MEATAQDDQSTTQRPVVAEYFCPRCGAVQFYVQSIRDNLKQGPICSLDSVPLQPLANAPAA